MKTTFIATYRLLFGLLGLFALIHQAFYSARFDDLDMVNYVSYFTNLSNLIAAIVFLSGAYFLFKDKKVPQGFSIARGAATLFMTVTGIVYITLLRDVDLGLLQVWVNIVTHMLLPVVVLADWVFAPSETRLTRKHLGIWLSFPLLYFAYSLIRGEITSWYPYPFLNPSKVGGYVGIVIYSVAICAMFGLVALALQKISNRKTTVK